jgi:hypothetical protein
MRIKLPPEVRELIEVRDRLRVRYAASRLNFTIDGNLVGDIGEAVASELFGVLLTATGGEGIDGYTLDKRSVQIKATGTRRGPAFRPTEFKADVLLFLSVDFANATGEVIYNGPEKYARDLFPKTWTSGQRSLSWKQIREADELVLDHERLHPIG